MPNRSLDDFAAGATEDEEEEAATSDAEPESPEEDETAETTDTAASEAEAADEAADEATDEPTLTVEAATPTYDFSPDGVACEACGETVEVRWHDPETGMVCGDCKRWN